MVAKSERSRETSRRRETRPMMTDVALTTSAIIAHLSQPLLLHLPTLHSKKKKKQATPSPPSSPSSSRSPAGPRAPMPLRRSSRLRAFPRVERRAASPPSSCPAAAAEAAAEEAAEAEAEAEGGALLQQPRSSSSSSSAPQRSPRLRLRSTLLL